MSPTPVNDASAPRLAPLPREQWGDDVRVALTNAYSDEVADRFLATGPDAIPTPSALATMMHHPALAGPFLTYNNVLLQTPTLEPRMRELMILRVAWRTRAFSHSQISAIGYPIGLFSEHKND